MSPLTWKPILFNLSEAHSVFRAILHEPDISIKIANSVGYFSIRGIPKRENTPETTISTNVTRK